jgi:flavin reductase (DIM6/NTAB) family NADH-FMN oxidoreductase RutF
MFYEPSKRNHGLRHDPFKALVAPRPIGWISTIAPDGRPNLAPYSFFNAIASRPPMVMFSSEGEKDSVRNIRLVPEFACSIVGLDQAREMNQTSAPLAWGENEFDFAGLEAAPSRLIRPPHVKGASAVLECKLLQILNPVDLDGAPSPSIIVLGQVVGVHVDERVIQDGMVLVERIKPVSRLGYNDYSAVESVFEMIRPNGDPTPRV